MHYCRPSSAVALAAKNLRPRPAADIYSTRCGRHTSSIHLGHVMQQLSSGRLSSDLAESSHHYTSPEEARRRPR